MKKLKPLGTNILILPKVEEDGYFEVPEDQKQKSNEAVIIATGEEYEGSLKEGMEVLFNPFNGVPVKMDASECKLVAKDDILAIIE